jgi:hypothetical protein
MSDCMYEPRERVLCIVHYLHVIGIYSLYLLFSVYISCPRSVVCRLVALLIAQSRNVVIEPVAIQFLW